VNTGICPRSPPWRSRSIATSGSHIPPLTQIGFNAAARNQGIGASEMLMCSPRCLQQVNPNSAQTVRAILAARGNCLRRIIQTRPTASGLDGACGARRKQLRTG